MTTIITALNGRLPASQLVVADTGPNGPQELATDAAASWRRMLAAGLPAGHLRSGYRTLAQQAEEVAAASYGLTPSALPPGRSWHGEGLAADEDEPGRSWLHAHGLAYGWIGNLVPAEPWHFQYDISQDTHLAEAASPASLPATTTEDEMARIMLHPNGTEALVGPGTSFRVLHTPTEVQALEAGGAVTGPLINLKTDGGGSTLIWDTLVQIARRAGTYSA